MLRRAAFIAGWTLIAAQSPLLMACPTCKEGLAENGQAGMNLAWGFELSIYLMLAVPMLIFGGLALIFSMQWKSADSAGRQAAFQQMVAAVEQSGRSMPPTT